MVTKLWIEHEPPGSYRSQRSQVLGDNNTGKWKHGNSRLSIQRRLESLIVQSSDSFFESIVFLHHFCPACFVSGSFHSFECNDELDLLFRTLLVFGNLGNVNLSLVSDKFHRRAHGVQTVHRTTLLCQVGQVSLTKSVRMIRFLCSSRCCSCCSCCS